MANELKCPYCSCNEHLFITIDLPLDVHLNEYGSVSMEEYTYNHSAEDTLMAAFEGDEKNIEGRSNLAVRCDNCGNVSYPVLDYTKNYGYDDITVVLALFKTREERDKKSDSIRLLQKLGE